MLFPHSITTSSLCQTLTHTKQLSYKKIQAEFKLLQALMGFFIDLFFIFYLLAGLKRSYTCEVCSVTLNSVAQYHAHLQGSKHQNK